MAFPATTSPRIMYPSEPTVLSLVSTLEPPVAAITAPADNE